MPTHNTYHDKYSSKREYREGADSRDFWRIFYQLPLNSCISVFFIDNTPERKLLEKITFTRQGTPFEESPDSYIAKLRDCFNRYGHKGFRELNLVWRRGFGNSIMIYIELY